MKLSRAKILHALDTDTPTHAIDTLISTALRYQTAANDAWNQQDMKLFRQMEKEFRSICEKLGIYKIKKEEKKKNLKEHFESNANNKQITKSKTKQTLRAAS